MNLPFRVYDVFAESPFAGTQIPVVIAKPDMDDALKLLIASEFSHSDTVFYDPSNEKSPFSVYNEKGKTKFGAHTTLAAAKAAHDFHISRITKNFFEYQLVDGELCVDTFVDDDPQGAAMTLFSRAFRFTTDQYVPELSRIAEALAIDVKHLFYARYKPRMVSVDTPVLVVPVTRPEHVIAARVDAERWSSLLAEVYASYILLIAPGSISGRADFHGRLIHPEFKADAYPPIGSIIPEFIAYLCSCEDTPQGTNTVSIDRGGLSSRQSLIYAEFDYNGGNKTKCRIGGKVILMSEGKFVY